jgi:hypothetical protein
MKLLKLFFTILFAFILASILAIGVGLPIVATFIGVLFVYALISYRWR